MKSKNSKNKCVQILNDYLMLDKNQRLPFLMTLHILMCQDCRKQIKMLSEAEKITCAPLKLQTPVTSEAIKNIMMKIDPETYEGKAVKPVRLLFWIIGGIAMISMLLFSLYSTSLMKSSSIMLIYALLIGFCVTLYCAIFVLSNVDYFVKKISTVLKESNKVFA